MVTPSPLYFPAYHKEADTRGNQLTGTWKTRERPCAPLCCYLTKRQKNWGVGWWYLSLNVLSFQAFPPYVIHFRFCPAELCQRTPGKTACLEGLGDFKKLG